MSLADTLKVLLKIMSLTKTIISIVTSQGKDDITEISIAILSRNDCSNVFHCWQVVSASIVSLIKLALTV